MIYEIFTHGGGDYVVEVLNAIVRVMGGNNFLAAIKISLLFGFFTVFLDIAINGSFIKSAKFYLIAMLSYNMLFLPKVDVIVTDPVSSITTDRKVDNVPFGLAFFAHTISSLGNWLTDTFEMNFALPDDLRYNKTGLLFGSTVLEQTLSTRISDSRVRNNFHNFIRQCITTSVHLKITTLDDVLKSQDIATLLNYGQNGVLAFEFTDKANQTTNRLCKDSGDLKSELDGEITKIIANQQTKNNGKSGDEVLSYMLDVSESTNKVFGQTLMMNAIEDSAEEYLAMVGAEAGATNYAITKDDLQRKQTGILQWLQADKYLPLLKITIEAMFYAMFPIVIVMLVLPNGFKIFKSYILILIALQMWAPLYAILNLIMTLQQKHRINLLMTETGNIISLYNRQAILNISKGIMTQAGVLAWSIPILSYKIVVGMQGLAEGLNNIAQSGASTTNQVASEVGSGSLSYGNANFKNTSWGNESYSNTNANKYDTDTVKNYGKSFETGGDGITHSKYSDGLETTNTSKRISSNLGTNFTTNENQSVASQIALKSAKSSTESYANAYSKSLQDLQQFSFADSQANSKTHSLSNSDAIKGNFGVSGKIGTSSNNIHAGVDYDKIISWADSNNISAEDKKTLNDLVGKTKQYEISYNQAYNEQKSKESDLNYALNTSVSSGFNANNEVERHLREDLGWSQEKIDYTAKNNAREIELLGRKHLSSQVFSSNKPKMFDEINSSIDVAKNSNENQNNIIDSQYNYSKNSLEKDNSLKMFQNTDPTNWTDFSTSKKKSN